MKNKTTLYSAFIALTALTLGGNVLGFGIPGVGDIDPKKAAEDLAKSKVAEAKNKATSKAKGALNNAKNKATGAATQAVAGKVGAAGSLFP